MATATITQWKQGTDLPYALPVADGMLAILLRADWLKADRSGRPVLLPPAIRALDRARALFAVENRITRGFIISLREALSLTQEQFARKVGVSKMTVSRWECGRMQPGRSAIARIRKLQEGARREGVRIDVHKR